MRDLSRLGPHAARRVVRKLEQAAQDLLRFFTRLAGFDDQKLRIGGYRLLAVLVQETETVIVERVGHRSWIYDRGR